MLLARAMVYLIHVNSFSIDVPLCGCKAIKDEGLLDSGIYKINPNDGHGEFTVFCDMDLQGGGWTIIQRRVDNATTFDRKRKAYNVGFGHLDGGNFWLGLEKIKRITDTSTHELYIGMESFLTGSSQLSSKRYTSFGLGTDSNDYTLSVSGYTGSNQDSLTPHNGKKFSTPDEDNDESAAHCASDYKSGWWYNGVCHGSHLNGYYYWDGNGPIGSVDGIVWQSWLGYETSMKTVVMAVRPA